MAITKILHINEVDMGNPARHLEQALDYIQNPEKTNENVLVGSINCLPETAFEQMMDTKMTFGKTDKRQGYHIIISFVPGETTEEIAFDIVERFAKEYLKDEYEAVYAVHNDKDHMHAHLIFNSVNLVTGVKYEYRKGEWKRRMQPITNKLCKEYNLEIMPAEYAKEPKNLSRVEWEQEQQFREMILADAIFCQNYAGSMDHFIFLMKRIGYQFEYGKYLSVKVPGGKWYHQLDKLDERFEEENFKYYLDMGISMPRFISSNPVYLYRSGLSEFQLKFYHKMYRIRMVEQKRFDKNAAWMAKELQKFHQLQKEYLFLVNNDIKSEEGLVTYEVLKEMDMERISNRQKEIYKEFGVRKRACKTMADIREFQIWHMQAQEELDDLKAEKKEIKGNLKLVEGCKKELQQFTMLDLVSIEEKVSNTVQVPEYPYGDESTEPVMDVTEDSENEPVIQDSAWEVWDDGTVALDVADNDLDIVEDVVVSVETEINAEEYVEDKNLSEVGFADAEESKDKGTFVTYESFMSMSPEDMAGILGFDRIVGIDEVYSRVSSFFRDVKSDVDGNVIVDVAKLADKEKAELFRFQPDDNNHNLELHMAVLKNCGMKLEFDEVYEDYQRIYDKTMEMQNEKKNERGESGRGRAR